MSNIPIIITINDTAARKSLNQVRKEIHSLVKFAQEPIKLSFDTAALNASFVKYREGIKKMQEMAVINVKMNIPENLKHTTVNVVPVLSAEAISSMNGQIAKGLSKVKTEIDISATKALIEIRHVRDELELLAYGVNRPLYLNIESSTAGLEIYNLKNLVTLLRDDLKNPLKLQIQSQDLNKILSDINKLNTLIQQTNKNKVNISVGNVGLRAELTKVLDGIKTRLDSFSKNNPLKISAKLDAQSLTSELGKIKNQLKAIQSGSVNISINVGNALRTLSALEARINLLTSTTHVVRIDTSTSIASIQNLVSQLNHIQSAVVNASSSMNSLNTNIRIGTHGAVQGFSGLSGALRTFGDDLQRILAVGFGAGLAKDAIKAANSFISMSNALTAMVGSQEKAAEANKFLRATSQDLGADFKELTESYTKYIASAKGANISSDQFHESFTRITQAATVLNFTADQTHGIFKALGQIFSKGKVQAEELRGQLGEHLYGAFELVAQGMKKTTAELDAMLKKGQLGPVEMILALSKAIEESFGDALPRAIVTGRSEFSRFVNDIEMGLDTNKEAVDKLVFGIANDLRAAFAIATAGGTDSMATLTAMADSLGAAIKGITLELKLVTIGVKYMATSFINEMMRMYEEAVAFKNFFADLFAPGDMNLNAESPLDKMTKSLKATADLHDEVAKSINNEAVAQRDAATAALTGTNQAYEVAKKYREELERINQTYTGQERISKGLELYNKFIQANKVAPDLSDVFKNYDPKTQDVQGKSDNFDKTFKRRLNKSETIIEGLKEDIIKLRSAADDGKTIDLEAQIELIRAKFKAINIYGAKLHEAEGLVREKYRQTQENFSTKTSASLAEDVESLKDSLADNKVDAEIRKIEHSYAIMGMTAEDVRTKEAVALVKQKAAMNDYISIKGELISNEEKYLEELDKINAVRKQGFIDDEQEITLKRRLADEFANLILQEDKYQHIRNIARAGADETDIGMTKGVTKFNIQGGQTDPAGEAFGNVMGIVGKASRNEDIFPKQLQELRDFNEQKKQLLIEAGMATNEELLKIDIEYNEKRNSLQSQQDDARIGAVSSVLNEVSGLMKSKNHEMAMIGKAAAIANATINTYQMAVGAYNAMASIPYVGPALGIAAAAAAVVFGVAQIATIASTPIAHGGLDYVPKESTYLLDKGERVLSPNQNRDLTNFMKDGNGQSGNNYNVSIHMNGNGQSSEEGRKAAEAFMRTIARAEIKDATRPNNTLNQINKF